MAALHLDKSQTTSEKRVKISALQKALSYSNRIHKMKSMYYNNIYYCSTQEKEVYCYFHWIFMPDKYLQKEKL